MKNNFYFCSSAIFFNQKYFYFQTKLSKILSIKKQWIQELKEMNTQAEKQVCVYICSLKTKIIDL